MTEPARISDPGSAHVAVIGAGFAGLEVARTLGRAGIRTTVIDRRNHHLFQPLLYQVATAALSGPDVAEPIRAIMRRYPSVSVVMAEVRKIDTGTRRLHLVGGDVIRFTHLVVAAGADTSYLGHDDWAEWAPGLKSVDDARRIRSRLLSTFEQAEACDDLERRRHLQTIAIIGGGPTGVEMAGAISELCRLTLRRDFRRIDPGDTRIMLIEAGPKLLPGFPDPLSDYAAARLRRNGVQVTTDAPVQHIEAGHLTMQDQTIPVGLVIWAAGVQPSPLAAQLGTPDDDGRIPVSDRLAVAGLDDIYALGDLAACAGPDGKPLPGLAQVARQQGLYLGRALVDRIRDGQPMQPFRYRSIGNTAIVGRNAAVFDHPRFRFKGWPAWFSWVVIHVYLLTGLQNRLLVTAQWVWRYLTHYRGSRVIDGDTRRPDADP